MAKENKEAEREIQNQPEDLESTEELLNVSGSVSSSNSLLNKRKSRGERTDLGGQHFDNCDEKHLNSKNYDLELVEFLFLNAILLLFPITILVLYIFTVIYHIFTMLVSFFPLLKTLLVHSLGLLLIAFGIGEINPCVSAFGGDQFILPQQVHYLSVFFSVFYFAINSGSLISTFVTPILRSDVFCLEGSTCHSLAFFVPAILMIFSIIIFRIGKNLYIIKDPEGNILFEVSKCIWHAISKKCGSKKVQREHWLDHADEKYDKMLIEDIKAAVQVLKLFVALPEFWALFDQQGSRWTFQPARMNSELDSHTIKSDQMQVINLD